jgi:hypothetical protein
MNQAYGKSLLEFLFTEIGYTKFIQLKKVQTW